MTTTNCVLRNTYSYVSVSVPNCAHGGCLAGGSSCSVSLERALSCKIKRWQRKSSAFGGWAGAAGLVALADGFVLAWHHWAWVAEVVVWVNTCAYPICREGLSIRYQDAMLHRSDICTDRTAQRNSRCIGLLYV